MSNTIYQETTSEWILVRFYMALMFLLELFGDPDKPELLGRFKVECENWKTALGEESYKKLKIEIEKIEMRIETGKIKNRAQLMYWEHQLWIKLKSNYNNRSLPNIDRLSYDDFLTFNQFKDYHITYKQVISKNYSAPLYKRFLEFKENLSWSKIFIQVGVYFISLIGISYFNSEVLGIDFANDEPTALSGQAGLMQLFLPFLIAKFVGKRYKISKYKAWFKKYYDENDSDHHGILNQLNDEEKKEMYLYMKSDITENSDSDRVNFARKEEIEEAQTQIETQPKKMDADFQDLKESISEEKYKINDSETKEDRLIVHKTDKQLREKIIEEVFGFQEEPVEFLSFYSNSDRYIYVLMFAPPIIAASVLFVRNILDGDSNVLMNILIFIAMLLAFYVAWFLFLVAMPYIIVVIFGILYLATSLVVWILDLIISPFLPKEKKNILRKVFDKYFKDNKKAEKVKLTPKQKEKLLVRVDKKGLQYKNRFYAWKDIELPESFRKLVLEVMFKELDSNLDSNTFNLNFNYKGKKTNLHVTHVGDSYMIYGAVWYFYNLREEQAQ